MDHAGARSSAELLGNAGSDPAGVLDRKNERLRVYNRSQESFVSLEVAAYDSTAEPLKKLFDYLVTGSDASLWLKPFQGDSSEARS